MTNTEARELARLKLCADTAWQAARGPVPLSVTLRGQAEVDALRARQHAEEARTYLAFTQYRDLVA